MSDLAKLVALCTNGIYLRVNEHRDMYQSIEKHLEYDETAKQETPPRVWAEMIRTDTLVDLQAYPDSAIGSYQIYHYDVEAAINTMLAIVERSKAVGAKQGALIDKLNSILYEPKDAPNE